MKSKLVSYLTTSLAILFGSIGCVRPTDRPVITQNPPSNQTEKVASFGEILPFHSSGFVLSPNGEMYFTNFQKAGRIGKLKLGGKDQAEVFIDLSEWLSPVGGRKPKAEGLRLDDQGRLLIAESEQANCSEFHPMLENLKSLLILMTATDLPRSRILRSGQVVTFS